MSSNQPHNQFRYAPFIYLAFFLSGMCGLSYQIIWLRKLTLIFGGTVPATTTVLVAFMSGLAIGSFYFGRWIDKTPKNPIRIYGWLELGIGLYACIILVLFKLTEIIYIPLYQQFEPSLYLFNLLRFIIVFLVLIIPTVFMGATLPIITKFFIGNINQLGKKLGTLYGLNTLGAALGTFLVGFFLLPRWGLTLTLYLTALLNIVIGLACLGWAKSLFSQPTIKPLPKSVSADPRYPLIAILLLVAIAVSGFASMCYEIAWTRVLSLILGSSIYAFSTMLVTFILGIALGSLLFSIYFKTDKREPKLTHLGWIEFGIGLFALVTIPLFSLMPYLFLYLFKISSAHAWIVTIEFILCFIVMLPPTILMGISFPLVAQLVSQVLPSRPQIGTIVGRVYSANTFGCVLGAFLCGFILIPWLGVQNSICTAIIINLAVAGVIFLTTNYTNYTNRPEGEPGLIRGIRIIRGCILPCIVLIIAILGLTLLPDWNKQIMTGGVAVRPHHYNNPSHFYQSVHHENILYYKDGLNCTVSVHQNPKFTTLRINGKADASNHIQDMPSQLLLAYLPIITHPQPRNALLVGLGSGVTCGTLAEMGLAVDCSEIEPAVVEAARFFNQENHNVLENDRVNIILNDARTHILSTNKKYDLIISGLSNLWVAGIANLYTRDFYLLCQKILTQNGIMCQWIHSYSMRPEDLKIVIATFHSVFPHTTVWNMTPNNHLLIGTPQEFWIDPNRVTKLLKNHAVFANDLHTMDITSDLALLFYSFALAESEVRQLVQNSRLNTDDLPLLEFSAPKALYAETRKANYEFINSIPSSLPMIKDAQTKKRLFSA